MVNQTIESIYTFLSKGRTKVMGILNITPDSFSNDGLLLHESACDAVLHRVRQFIEQGVDIIDIGGESTRPEAAPVSLGDELKRVIDVVKKVRNHFPEILISIDTMKPQVAQEALKVGANIINDVSGVADSGMIEVAVNGAVPLVLTHSQRTWRSWDNKLSTADAVTADMSHLIKQACGRGLDTRQIILDPGIGFGKTVRQNLDLIHGVGKLNDLGYPVLLGVSRKSFIGHTTGDPVEKRLPGSLSAATIGVMQGVKIIRAHDVAETVQALRIVDAMMYPSYD